MASEVMGSDSATEKKIDVFEATSSFVRKDDPSAVVKPVENQELGIGSASYGPAEGLASQKSHEMVPTSDSVAKKGFQEFQEPENFSGVLISDEERVQEKPVDLSGLERKHPLNDVEVGSSSNFDNSSACNGKPSFREVGKINDCNGDEGLLEVKKKQLLEELEVGSIFRGISPSEHPGERTKNLPDFGIEKFANGVDGYLRSSLKIEVIDDTAVIEPIVGTGIVNAKEKNSKEDLEEKKPKRIRRKGKGRKTGSEKAELPAQVVWKNGDGTKIMYSREEMEALRFVGVAEQRKLWREIYNGLGPVVAREYMSLTGSKHQQKGKLVSEASQPVKRSHGPGILGEHCHSFFLILFMFSVACYCNVHMFAHDV